MLVQLPALGTQSILTYYTHEHFQPPTRKSTLLLKAGIPVSDVTQMHHQSEGSWFPLCKTVFV